MAKRNRKGASQDVRKAGNSEKNLNGDPAEDKILDGLCDAVKAVEVKEVEKDTIKLNTEATDEEKQQKTTVDQEPDAKHLEEEEVKQDDESIEAVKVADEKEKEEPTEDSKKADEKPEFPLEARFDDDKEESIKPFKVVDDVEKEEYAKEEKEDKKGDEKPANDSSTSKQQQPMMRTPPTKKEYKIPREWASYSKCGEVVPTTPFLPFKSPLSEDRFTRHPELEEHTICSLIQDLSSKGIRLTTVIDLTLPFFYEIEFLEAFDIRYEKIRIDNQEPRWHQIKKFLEICDDFAVQQHKRRIEWEERQAERKARGEDEEYYMYEVIGVHCTRGVNRTGYMICRAMIERMNYTAEHAVKLFNEARGHDMTEFMPELKRAEEKKRMYDMKNLNGGGRGGGGGERGRGGVPRGRGQY